MDVDEALRRRWRATGLPTATPAPAAASAADEVRRLGAVQAQDFEPTLWSLGRRTGQSRAEVLRQFEAGEFVRTHALRQTWHVVHAYDLTTIQAATAHRVHRANAAVYRQEGLDADVLARAAEVITRAVADGPVTRVRMGERLSAVGFDVAGFRLGILMMWAELECLVASGPLAGRRQTYAAWPTGPRPDRGQSIVTLARRFFTSHAPATLADFTSWSSLTLTEAREATAGLPLARATVAGVECLWLDDAGADPWDTPQVELLNGYDEYISGVSAAGKRWLDRAGLARGRPGTPISAVMVDCQLAGHWRRSAGQGEAVLDVLPLRRFRHAEQLALEGAADAYGRFLGAAVTVRLRPPEA
jgi:hypothetical protein